MPPDTTPWAWPVMYDAQRTILLDVLFHGSRSRADLARRSGLSRTTLTRLTRDLVNFGFVREGETAAPNGRGRPSEMLDLRVEAAYFVGIKLTGDTLYTVVIDLAASILMSEEHSLVSKDVEDVVALIDSIVARLRVQFVRFAAVGVCLAGTTQIDHEHLVVRNSPFLGWDDVRLADLITAKTGLPTTVSNDARALTAAHHSFGAGVGCSSLVVIALGMGIGAGIVVDDEIVGGEESSPGKIGHVPVAIDGPTCARGHIGCASAFVTSPSIIRNAGGDGSYDDVVRRCEDGDATALAAFTAAGRALGIVIAQVVNLVGPEKVVVTGEGLAVFDFAERAVRGALEDWLDPEASAVMLEVHPFRFADFAWGAAISALRALM